MSMIERYRMLVFEERNTDLRVSKIMSGVMSEIMRARLVWGHDITYPVRLTH